MLPVTGLPLPGDVFDSLKIAGHESERANILVRERDQHHPLEFGGFVDLNRLGDLPRALVDGAEERQTGDFLFEVVEQPPAEYVGRQHPEQKKQDQRHDCTDTDQGFADNPF